MSEETVLYIRLKHGLPPPEVPQAGRVDYLESLPLDFLRIHGYGKGYNKDSLKINFKGMYVSSSILLSKLVNYYEWQARRPS